MSPACCLTYHESKESTNQWVCRGHQEACLLGFFAEMRMSITWCLMGIWGWAKQHKPFFSCHPSTRNKVAAAPLRQYMHCVHFWQYALISNSARERFSETNWPFFRAVTGGTQWKESPDFNREETAGIQVGQWWSNDRTAIHCCHWPGIIVQAIVPETHFLLQKTINYNLLKETSVLHTYNNGDFTQKL